MKKNYIIPTLKTIQILHIRPLAGSNDILSKGIGTNITYGGISSNADDLDPEARQDNGFWGSSFWE